MRLRSNRGQATVEYVGIMLLVALIVGGVLIASFAFPPLKKELAHSIRLGICIVSGQICRKSEAELAGLPPCLINQRSGRHANTIDVLIYRVGERESWELAVRSDGTATVTLADEKLGGVVGGIGASFSPLKLELAASGDATVGYRSGSGWNFASEARARKFLERRNAGKRPRPDIRWDGLTSAASGNATANLADLASAGVETDLSSARGLRREADSKTLTMELNNNGTGPVLKALRWGTGKHDQQSLVADLTWKRGRLSELMIRSAKIEQDRISEVSASLDLTDKGTMAAVARYLKNPVSPLNADGIANYIRSYGTVEQRRYSLKTASKGFGFAARLGGSLAFNNEKVAAERRLTDATSWTRDGVALQRFDCLGM